MRYLGGIGGGVCGFGSCGCRISSSKYLLEGWTVGCFMWYDIWVLVTAIRDELDLRVGAGGGGCIY